LTQNPRLHFFFQYLKKFNNGNGWHNSHIILYIIRGKLFGNDSASYKIKIYFYRRL